MPSRRSLPLFFLGSLALFCIPARSELAEALIPQDRFVDRIWDARWIAPPESPAREYGVYHFRKSIELASAPERFVVHVSADNRYTLYVNGRKVAFGPERGDLRHWRFDTYDLAPYLRGGSNVIAALVWNYGIEAPVAQISARTGFIMQGDDDLSGMANTDASWRVLANAAYSPIGDFMAKLRTYIVVGPGDEVDGSLYPWNWETPAFDDSAWPTASTLRAGMPRGTSTDGDWLLVPRSIPAMEFRPIRWQRVRRAEGVDVPDGFLEGRATLTVPARSRATLLLDYNELATGFPELRVSGGGGSSIALTYAESLYEGPSEEMSTVKGHRDEIEGKHIRGFEDRFWPDGGSERVFRPLQWRTYRYTEVAIETADEPLEIHDIRADFTAYPMEEKARFGSSMPVLEGIWDISWRTMRTGTHEVFTDTPYYEQLSYVGDTRLEALTAMYVSGDYRLVRKSIQSFDDSRQANGLTNSRYPDSRHQLIPPFSLVWISMVHDYWRLSDDHDFVKARLPGVREVLRYFDEHSDPETGSYVGAKWWNFVDWISAWGRDKVVGLGGVPPRDASGASAVLDLQYVYTLQQARDLHLAFGEEELARRYGDRATALRQRVASACWSESRGLLADTSDQDSFSQHANALFILTAEGEAPALRSLAQRMVEDEAMEQATLYFQFYVHQALQAAGAGDLYLDQLDLWEALLEQGLTSLPERPHPDTRSDSHAWGAHPMYHMLSFICGIAPLEAGFKSVRIAPQLGALEHASGAMPHPLGMIEVELRRAGEHGVQGSVTLPEGLSGVFDWNGQTMDLQSDRQSVSFE